MQLCRLSLLVSLTGLCFAVEPQISSVATLPLQYTSPTVSRRSRTPIVPVSEPIIWVPVTATAPPFFGVLTRKLLNPKKQNVVQLTFLQATSAQATSLQATSSPSPSPTAISTNTPGKWPRPRSTLDIRGTLLYLTILDYGYPIDSDHKKDIISNLALIVAEIDRGGNPGEILPTATYKKDIVNFQYARRTRVGSYAIGRKELSLVLETIIGLTVSDGSRRIRMAFLSRGRALLGEFSLDYIITGSTSVSQPPQNSSFAIPGEP